MSKMSFEGFLGILILILNSEIQLEIIQTHKGCSRSCKGQMLEKYTYNGPLSDLYEIMFCVPIYERSEFRGISHFYPNLRCPDWTKTQTPTQTQQNLTLELHKNSFGSGSLLT